MNLYDKKSPVFFKNSPSFFRPLINSNSEDAPAGTYGNVTIATLLFSRSVEISVWKFSQKMKIKYEKLDRCFHEHDSEKLGSENVIYTKTCCWLNPDSAFLVTAPKTAVCYSNAVFKCNFEYSFECSSYKQHFRKRRVTYNFEICNPRCIFSNLAARSAYLENSLAFSFLKTFVIFSTAL